MNRIEKAIEFRELINANLNATRKLIRVDELSEDELINLINLYEDWIVGEALSIGDYRKHNNQLYEVIQSHTTQADWEPQNVPALFKKVEPEGVLREIPETILATEAFMKGEKGTWKSKVYESLIANNVWNPDVHASGWKLVE